MREPDATFSDPRQAVLYDVFNNDRSDLHAYVRIADEVEAHCVVDVGCGTGSLAVRLAELGFPSPGLTLLEPLWFGHHRRGRHGQGHCGGYPDAKFCHEVRVLPGALTLRERDMMLRLVEVSSTSRGRILRRSPPRRPIEADVLICRGDEDSGDAEEGEQRSETRLSSLGSSWSRRHHKSQFTGVSGRLETLSSAGELRLSTANQG